MDYCIKKGRFLIPICAEQAADAGTDISIKAATLPQPPGFCKWYFYSFFTQSLKRETQRYRFLKWFTTMVSKRVSSWEKVREVIHRRALKSSPVMITTLGRLQALRKQRLQTTLSSCTWIYQLAGNRMYTETARYEMFTLPGIQTRLRDTS